MTTPTNPTRSTSQDRRTQAVLERMAAVIAQVQIDQTLRQQIMDQVFDTSHAAAFRAAHSADFINKLLAVTPSLTTQQQRELQGVVDDLILIARNTSRETYERGRIVQQEARELSRKPDALATFVTEVQGEWQDFCDGVKEEWDAFTRWLRS